MRGWIRRKVCSKGTSSRVENAQEAGTMRLLRKDSGLQYYEALSFKPEHVHESMYSALHRSHHAVASVYSVSL
jgi:hypothetical protein